MISKKHSKPLLTVLFIGLFSFQALAGASNGGGGYSVRCNDGKFYAMDFLATQKASSDIAPEIQSATTSDEIFARILNRLKTVNPELAVSYQDFIDRNESESNTNTMRLWINGIHPLEKLTDEQRIRNLRDCLGSNQQTDVFQAVIRKRFPNGVVYNRDPEQLRNLEATNPLQVSFTYNHEWLRDFTDDPEILMEVNYFLHSKDFFSMSRDQIEMVFRRHGLENLPGMKPVSESLSLASTYKVSWDGALFYHIDGVAQVSVLLCGTPIEVHRQTGSWDDNLDQTPDISPCEELHKTPEQTVKDASWTVFGSHSQANMQPFELMIPSSRIHALSEKIRTQGEKNGPYLVFLLQVRLSDRTFYATMNYDLSKSYEKNEHFISGFKEQEGPCSFMGYGCEPEKPNTIQLTKLIDHDGGLHHSRLDAFYTFFQVQNISLMDH